MEYDPSIDFIPLLLPRNRYKRDLVLKMLLYSSDILAEILELLNANRPVAQRDIIKRLGHHSNKTILKLLRELKESGMVTEEYIESETRSGRRIKIKCYRLTSLGRTLHAMIMGSYESAHELYHLLGAYMGLSIQGYCSHVRNCLGELYRGAIRSILGLHRHRGMVDLVVVGSIAMDYHVEVVNGLYSLMTIEPGGSGANIASMSSRLGLSTKLVSAVGADHDGLLSIHSLHGDGVILSDTILYDDRLTIKVLIIHEGSEVRLKKVVGRGIAIAPEPSMVDWDDVRARVYYAGDTYVENAIKVGEKALDEGKLFIYSPTTEIIEYSPKNVVRVISDYKPLLIVNEAEFVKLNTIAGLTPKDILGLGVEALIITMGPRGVKLYTRGGLLRYIPPRAKTIDPTGSGDCLISYTIWRLFKGDDLVEALKWGVSSSAIAVTKIGVRHLPRVNEVEETLNNIKVIRER